MADESQYRRFLREDECVAVAIVRQELSGFGAANADDELTLIVERLATERDRAEQLRLDVVYQRRRAEALGKCAGHGQGCVLTWGSWGPRICTCGLDAARTLPSDRPAGWTPESEEE